METTLEKMARAISATGYIGDRAQANPDDLIAAREMARAALLAIREPDEDVREAGIAALRGDPHNINPYQAWSAMIDAVLNAK